MRRPGPDDVDDLVDLDPEDDDGGRADRAGDRRGRRSPGASRWGRSPWALPATVTVLVLVGGLAGLRQAHAAADADLARERRVAAVQLGAVSVPYVVSPSDGQPVGDPARQRVQVAVLNSGDAPVTVAVLGTSLASAELVPGAVTVPLRPGSGGMLDIDLTIDCGRVLPPDSSGSPPPAAAEWLDLAVQTDDRPGSSTRHRYLLPETGWGGLSEQVRYVCHPNAWSGGLSASPTFGDDGTLHVAMTNVQQEPVRVVLQAPASLGVTADPPVPLDVAAGESTEVRLALAPDCASLPEGIGDPYALPVELVAERDGSAGPGVLDTTTSAVWVARQLALACG